MHSHYFYYKIRHSQDLIMKLNLKNFRDIPKLSRIDIKAYKKENRSLRSIKSSMELLLRMSSKRGYKKKNLSCDLRIKNRRIYELLTYFYASYFSRTLDLKSNFNIDNYKPTLLGCRHNKLENYFKKVILKFDSGFFFSNIYDDEHYSSLRGKFLFILNFNKGISTEILKGLKNILILSSLGMKYCIKKRQYEKQNKKRYNKKKIIQKI